MTSFAPSETLSPVDASKLNWFYKRYAEDFYREYRIGHFLLAAYAAVPALLTPDLLYKIWQNFHGYRWNDAPASIHRIAVSDVLLSPLCREAGFELYEMHWPIRVNLLQWLAVEGEEEIWKQRKLYSIKEIARFVEGYHYLPNPGNNRWGESYAETQALEAISYNDPEKAAALLFNKISKASNPEAPNETELLKTLDMFVKTGERLKFLGHKGFADGYRNDIAWMDAWKALIESNTKGFLEKLNARPELLQLLTETANGGIRVEIKESLVEKINLSAGRKQQKLWAVVCGVSEFDHADIDGVEHCAANARRLTKFLTEYCPLLGIDLSFCALPANGSVTRGEVMAALEQLKEAKEGDTCLFFYSGAAMISTSSGGWLDFLFSDDETVLIPELTTELRNTVNELSRRDLFLFTVTDVHRAVEAEGEMPAFDLSGSFLSLENCIPKVLAERTKFADGPPSISNNFFNAFLDLLRESGARLTHGELFSRLKLRIKQREVNYLPFGTYFSSPELLDCMFFTRRPKQQSGYRVSYDDGLQRWVVNAGTKQGIRPSLSFMQTLFQLEDKRTVSVAEVFDGQSTLNESPAGSAERPALAEKDTGATYAAVLKQLALPKIVVAFHPAMNEEDKQGILWAVDRHEIHFIDLTNDPSSAKYIINGGREGYYLTYAFKSNVDQASLTPEPVFGFQREPFEFIKQMEYIAKWQGVLELDNLDSHIPRTAIDINFEIIEGQQWTNETADQLSGTQVSNPDEVVLHYQKSGEHWIQPAFRCRVKNTVAEGKAYFVTVLFLGSLYEIQDDIKQYRLPAGGSMHLEFEVHGRPYRTIRIRIEEFYLERNVLEVYEYLKFFVSEEPMEVTELTQDALEFGRTVQTRGIQAKTLQGSFITPSSDWTAITVPLKTVRRDADEDFRLRAERLYRATDVVVPDDLQKNRWGGRNNGNGLQLNASVTDAAIPGFYSITATVHSTDPARKTFTGQAAFFLHDTFSNEIEYVQAQNGVATLQIGLCYEAFTLAAYTQDGTTLELDLNEVPGYPKGFYWKELSGFQNGVRELYKQKPSGTDGDLQKGRWGGRNTANGKTLRAEVDKSWIPGFYNVRLQISFSNPKEAGSEAAFFLHKRLGRQIRFVPVRDGVAALKIRTDEAVTVGAYTEDGTELELDLNEGKGFPEGFYRDKKQNV